MQRHLYNNDNIYNCIFKNTFPTVTVYPFSKSSVTVLCTLPVTLQLDSRVAENTTVKHEVLSKVVTRIKNDNLTSASLAQFFKNTPHTFNDLILKNFFEHYIKWHDFFDTNILAFTETNRSRFQWELVKSIGIDTLFNKPYSYEQRLWMVYANFNAKRDDQRFVIEIVESLKPWLNNELYHAVKKSTENTKINAEFERQHEEMLAGSFGMSDTDKQVISTLDNNDVTVPKVKEIGDTSDLDIIK